MRLPVPRTSSVRTEIRPIRFGRRSPDTLLDRNTPAPRRKLASGKHTRLPHPPRKKSSRSKEGADKLGASDEIRTHACAFRVRRLPLKPLESGSAHSKRSVALIRHHVSKLRGSRLSRCQGLLRIQGTARPDRLTVSVPQRPEPRPALRPARTVVGHGGRPHPQLRGIVTEQLRTLLAADRHLP